MLSCAIVCDRYLRSFRAATAAVTGIGNKFRAATAAVTRIGNKFRAATAAVTVIANQFLRENGLLVINTFCANGIQDEINAPLEMQ